VAQGPVGDAMTWRPYLASRWWQVFSWTLRHPDIRRTGPVVWIRRMTPAERLVMLGRLK